MDPFTLILGLGTELFAMVIFGIMAIMLFIAIAGSAAIIYFIIKIVKKYLNS